MDIARASIKRGTVVLFICVLIALGGVAAYFSIGKLEDPAFTIKTAVVSIAYPDLLHTKQKKKLQAEWKMLFRQWEKSKRYVHAVYQD